MKLKKIMVTFVITGLMTSNLALTNYGHENVMEPGFNQQEEKNQNLSTEETQIVKDILNDYNNATLTKDDALEMNERFRQAGIKGGKALAIVIESMGFDTEKIRTLAPPPNASNNTKPRPEDESADENRPPRPEDESGDQNRPPRPEDETQDKSSQNSKNRYSIEQATSDNAQLHTLAFDALSFITGSFSSDTQLPPGKLADYFGFQYLRDVDAGEAGHSTMFLTTVADNMFYILDEAQIAKLNTLANEQVTLVDDYYYDRLTIMHAFRKLEDNDLPLMTTQLNSDALEDYSSELYEIDGKLSYRRAQVFADVIASLTDSQKTYLDNMVAGNSSTWTQFPNEQLDKKGLSHSEHVLMMTYASEMFSWYAGDTQSDTYFCPERQATYFGSFYLKSKPASSDVNYRIDTNLTGDSGKDFLNVLTTEQRTLIENLVDIQREDLMEIVKVREAIATELRKSLAGQVVDEEKVLNLSRQYGLLDGRIVSAYINSFTQVSDSLSIEQMDQLMAIRYYGSEENKVFLFSSEANIPSINSDFLFK